MIEELIRQFDQITRENGVQVITDAITQEELNSRKADFALALNLFPKKLLGGLKSIKLNAELDRRESSEPKITKEGRVILVPGVYSYGGSLLSQRLMGKLTQLSDDQYVNT